MFANLVILLYTYKESNISGIQITAGQMHVCIHGLVVVAAAEGASGVLAASAPRPGSGAGRLPCSFLAGFVLARRSAQSSAALALLRTCFPLTASTVSRCRQRRRTPTITLAQHLGISMLSATLTLLAALALGEYNIEILDLF